MLRLYFNIILTSSPGSLHFSSYSPFLFVSSNVYFLIFPPSLSRITTEKLSPGFLGGDKEIRALLKSGTHKIKFGNYTMFVCPMEYNEWLPIYYNNEKRVDFQDFLFNLSNIKHFISSLLDSYTNLLHSLIRLNDENICFFNLNTDNIVFSNNNTLILKNFKNSLLISNLNESYIKNIIKNIDNYTYKPLEIHVLFYLIINNEETLSLSFIETICSNYVKNMDILLLFSQKYIESYEKTCVETLKKYINKPKSVIITDILEYNKYWDNYSISILYLHIIGNITRFFSLKGTFLNKFTMLLTKNIHPNPLKRETLEETIKNYNKLFYDNEDDDWFFINDVSNEKLKKLYDYLLN